MKFGETILESFRKKTVLKKGGSRKGVLKKTSAALAIVLALSVCLTGCGGSGSGNSQKPGDGTASQSSEQKKGNVEEGLLRTAVLFDISTMDVTMTSDDYMVPMNIFDRLFETRMVDGTAQIVNSLCDDYTVSDDGLKYDFVLKSGIVFSNGSALTASDVKYSFERLLIEAGQNTDIPLKIAGGAALMEKKADSLEGFTVTDDTHFSITLDAPSAGFLAELSAPAMSIVDAETMEKVKNFGSDPADTIGTGPYIISEWEANDHFTMVYNDKYWGNEPSVKKVIVRVIPDSGTQNLMFQNGELDIINLMNLDSAVVESSYKNNSEYADRIISTPYVGLNAIIMNENNKYLQDVNVRKAIGMAIDVENLIANIYKGDAIQEKGIIPTGIWGHNDQFKVFEYNPDTAKKLLKESGYKDGEISFELSMDTTATTSVQLMYENISQSLEDIGIKASIKTYDHASWLNLRNSGEMDSYVGRWGMDYNDPSNIMMNFFGSKETIKIRSLNYKNEDVIARVNAAPAIVDDDERKAEYQALEEKMIAEDAVWVPLLTPLHLFCNGERVESFTPHWAGFSDFYAADVVLK